MEEPSEPRLGPAGAGEDLQRLIEDMRRKGMSGRQIDALRAGWEAACHDPMRKGRGGPSLPENAPQGRVPLPDKPKPPSGSPARPGLVKLLDTSQPLRVPFELAAEEDDD